MFLNLNTFFVLRENVVNSYQGWKIISSLYIIAARKLENIPLLFGQIFKFADNEEIALVCINTECESIDLKHKAY